MGCGSSKPATKDAAPIEQAEGVTTTSIGPAQAKSKTPEHNSTSSMANKKTLLPTSGLAPIEFGLVKGLEYGDKTAPALLVVQVSHGLFT